VENGLTAPHISLSSLPSLCQKFLRWKFDKVRIKNNFAQFFQKQCTFGDWPDLDQLRKMGWLKETGIFYYIYKHSQGFRAKAQTISGKTRKICFRPVPRVVSPEISPGKFPEIYTENFPLVQTFQMTVYLLTSSLSVGFFRTSGL